jgi:hypothetical protein
VVVAIPIVVVFVPIAFRAPAMGVFIPPAVIVSPAKLAGFAELGAGTGGLGTIPTMVFRRFVEPVIGPGDAPLAVMFVGCGARRCSEEQEPANGNCGEDRRSTQFDFPDQKRLHSFLLFARS